MLLRAQRDSNQEDREKAVWLAEHWRSRFYDLTRPYQSRGEQRVINRKRRMQALARSFVVRLRDTLDHEYADQSGVADVAPPQVAVPDILSSAPRPDMSAQPDGATSEHAVGLAEQSQRRLGAGAPYQAAKESLLERLRGGMGERLARAEQRDASQSDAQARSGGDSEGKGSTPQSAAARRAEALRNRLIAAQRQTTPPQVEGGRYGLSKNRGNPALASEQAARRGSVHEEA